MIFLGSIQVAFIIQLVDLFQNTSGVIFLGQFFLRTVDINFPQVVGLGQDQTPKFFKGFQTPNMHTAIQRRSGKRVFPFDYLN